MEAVRHPIFARVYERLSRVMERDIGEHRDELVSLAGALAVAGMAFGAKSPPKKPKKPGSPASAHAFSWHDTPTGSTASLRGLSAVSANVAWASGSAGTVLRTTDRGGNR